MRYCRTIHANAPLVTLGVREGGSGEVSGVRCQVSCVQHPPCLACSILLVLRAASSLCPQRLSQSSQFSVDAWHLSAAVMACSHRGRCSRIKRVAAGQSVPCRAPDRTSHLAQSGRAALTRRGQARGEGRGGGSRDSFSMGSRVCFSVGGYGLALAGMV
jgi:hypothetical protein